MRKWMLVAGAAALAVGVPAYADAQDRGGGKAKAEQGRQGGGQAKATRQARQGGNDRGRVRAVRQARQGGGDRDRVRAVRQARQGGDNDRGRALRVAQRDDDRARGQARARVRDDDRVRGQARIRADRDRDRAVVRARGEVEARRVARDNQDRDRDRSRVAVSDDDRRIAVRDRNRAKDNIVIRTRDGDRRVLARTRFFDDDDNVRIVRRDFDRDFFPGRGRGLIAGCPPGLDKRDNGCLPPGHARRLLGVPLAAAFRDDLVPLRYRSWFRDDDDFFFRSGNGFIYRVDRDDWRIDGIIPTFGSGYYALGDPWPSPYNFYNVPYQYRAYYYDDFDDDDCYRYDGWGAIYRVDCDRGLVSGIVALLAGDLGVGSRLPLGYDVYNVPLAYRARYYDTPTAWYRYNDGYIYRVDPQTRLISAVIDALV